jgi:hypothetical protein
VALRIEHDINDDLQLTAISDFKDYEKLLFLDVDGGPPTSRSTMRRSMPPASRRSCASTAPQTRPAGWPVSIT